MVTRNGADDLALQGPFNSAIVRRSWGLKEEMDDEDIKYGPSFSYNERMVTPDPVSAFMLSIFCFFFISLLGKTNKLKQRRLLTIM